MIVKGLATLAVLLALASAAPPLAAQASARPAAGKPTTPTHSTQDQTRPDCNGFPCEDQTPRTIYVPSAPAPILWAGHDRILWAAYLVLAIVGYIGIMLAVSTLKKIERNTAAAEETANAAAA